ncbi:unnamed protein product, partial [Effrenium voratum]
MMDDVRLDGKTFDRASSALLAVNSGGSQALQEARKVVEEARAHPTAELGTALASAEEAAVQHFGFQLVKERIEKNRVQRGQEWAGMKTWLLQRWQFDWLSRPSFVWGKYAEAVVAVAKHDWPTAWPELRAAILAPNLDLSKAVLSFSVWSQLAESLSDESLGAARRRELTAAFGRHFEEPPVFVEFLQRALHAFGGDVQILREALKLCRALPHAVPVRLLLKNKLDKIVEVGLQSEKELALTALAEWVQNLCPKGGNEPASHDLCRLTALMTRLVHECKFDAEDLCSLGSHQQVARLFCDLCTLNAAGMCSMPQTELSAIWEALLFLLRYPCAALQVDTLAAMVSLARAKATQPALENFVG